MRATLLCWNTAGKVRRLPEQAQHVVGCRTDIVCLQEVAASTVVPWTTALHTAGLEHIVVAELVPREPPPRRPLSVLTAARRPLQRIEISGLPWPERVLATGIAGLELINVHSPISPSPGLAKVITHETLHQHLRTGRGPRVLCGDLNTPRREHPDGRVWTFARDRYGKLRPERGERWDAAELSLIRGLEPFGFRDLFRDLHGLEVRELSWEWQRWGGGYRLDHVIASKDVSARRVEYVHEWRSAGLSDHSPLLAELEW